MSAHSDPGDLALSALGADVTRFGENFDAHLGTCGRCQSELDQLRAVVASVRGVGPDDYPTAPPLAVWHAIVGELGLANMSPPVGGVAAQRAGRVRAATVAIASAAAVAGILAGATGAVLLRDEPVAGPTEVTASARLEALAGTTGSGTVLVHGGSAGRVLELVVTDPTRSDGLREVWLLADDGRRLVSLGLLDGPSATFAVPPELDISDFAVVDVSREPADGDPTHSGDSVLRGRLSG